MTFKTFDQRNEETRPDQQEIDKDNDKDIDNDKDKDNDKDI